MDVSDFFGKSEKCSLKNQEQKTELYNSWSQERNAQIIMFH